MNYKHISLFLPLSLLLLAGCASEPSVVASPAAQKVAAADAGAAVETEVQTVPGNIETSADDDDRMICRSITPTGSHRKKRICRTVGEIKRERQAAQDVLRKGQGGPSGAPSDL